VRDRNYRGGPIIFRCDGSAADFIETGEPEFIPALAVARREGWSAVDLGPGHGWCHFCPACTEAKAWIGTDRINGKPL